MTRDAGLMPSAGLANAGPSRTALPLPTGATRRGGRSRVSWPGSATVLLPGLPRGPASRGHGGGCGCRPACRARPHSPLLLSQGLNLRYRFLMTNGPLGDYWHEHFSADEFCECAASFRRVCLFDPRGTTPVVAHMQTSKHYRSLRL